MCCVSCLSVTVLGTQFIFPVWKLNVLPFKKISSSYFFDFFFFLLRSCYSDIKPPLIYFSFPVFYLCSLSLPQFPRFFQPFYSDFYFKKPLFSGLFIVFSLISLLMGDINEDINDKFVFKVS